MTTWAMEEFAGAKLGDSRLNARLIKLATRFADKPTASIPGACSDWAETQAVYRFFDQASDDKRSLGWQDILDPHIAQTEARGGNTRSFFAGKTAPNWTSMGRVLPALVRSPTRPRAACTCIPPMS